MKSRLPAKRSAGLMFRVAYLATGSATVQERRAEENEASSTVAKMGYCHGRRYYASPLRQAGSWPRHACGAAGPVVRWSACGAHEGGELAVKAPRVLPERRMADVGIERKRGRRRLARGEFAHGGQHDLVLRAVGDEHRHVDALEHIARIESAIEHGGAHARRHQHVEGEHRRELLR